MADSSKYTPILLTVIALAIGYMGYTGDGLNLVGVEGMKSRMDRVSVTKDSLASVQGKLDTAKRDLAKESVEDVKKRVEGYRASLAVLRTLVPEQREVANLLDDVSMRARVRGVTLSNFVVNPPAPGPTPFDTYSYQITAIGHYHNVARFLTDVASLRRIIVAGDLAIVAPQIAQIRALGDTTAMIETRVLIRTYVKAKAAEDSTHGK